LFDKKELRMAEEVTHPGVVLLQRLIKAELSSNALALALGVTPARVHEIIRLKRGITPDTDLRLARYFDLPEGYWMKLQMAYDLAVGRERLASKLGKIIPYKTTRGKAAAT
jgi:antitoxin HigA-1